MSVPALALNDGRTIPQIGFGTSKVSSVDTIVQALEAGYRHIDTAQMYRNEEVVGQAIAASGIARDELFITTKLNNAFHRPDDARREFDASLTRLGVDRVDLFLMHWPLPTRYDGDFVSTWRTIAEFAEQGRATSIGVSNFQPDHLDRITAETGVVPSVNQVEAHPYFPNNAVREANRHHQVATVAWSPLARGALADEPVVVALADDLKRTAAQVVLRWHLQRSDVVIPKSSDPTRVAQNLALDDFALDAAQMASIDALDRGESGRTGPHPDTFDWIG